MKRIILFITVLFLALSAKAKPVSPDEASALAASFLKTPEVVRVQTLFNHLYVFNGPNSFVIISGDDRVLPVIGYSFDNQFVSESISESTYGWLYDRNNTVGAAMRKGIEASDEVKAAWELFRNKAQLPSFCRSSMGPLISTNWRQGDPYNMYCPDGCVTGCVATAMAQIMRYWEYPVQGTGSHSYEHPVYGTLSANFGGTVYDWGNMPGMIGSNSSNAAKRAIAILMYHCGVSVEANYNSSATSAPSNNVLTAMPAYFGYADDISMVYMDDYTDQEWKLLLMSELDALRPMYYAGQDRAHAHAFICDGYNEQGYFHINWGWGSVNDGFYAIGSLNPGDYTFNARNYAIIGIRPANGATPPIPAPVLVEGHPEDYDWVLEWKMATDNPAYTYKVSRDGTLIASGLTETTYVDANVPSGFHTYEVWASLNDLESNRKATYEVELARLEVISSDPEKGTVTGGGVEELDVLLIVKAEAKPGYVFLYWMEDGQIVSQEDELHVALDGDHTLTAYFSGTGVEEEDEHSTILGVEVFTLNGVRIKTFTADAINWEQCLEGCARGVYLVRITTDKGVIVKKIVLR